MTTAAAPADDLTWFRLTRVLTPPEESELRDLAADVRAQPDRLRRLHQRIRDLYWRHRDDDRPVTQAQLAEVTGYTPERINQIVNEAR